MARSTLGIYWDTVSVSACLLKVGISELVVEKLLSARRTPGSGSGAQQGDAGDIGSIIKGLGVVPDTCAVSLSENEIMYRPLLRPFGDRRKIAETIATEVETLLPVLEDRVIVDFIFLGKDDAGLYRLETLSARHSSVEHLITWLKAADLEPGIIDSPTVALAGGARNLFECEGGKRYVFLHMGWHDTSLAVLDGTELKYVGAFPYGFEKVAPGGLQDKETMDHALGEGVIASEALDAYIREILIALHRIGSPAGETVLVPLGYAHLIKDLPARFEDTSDIATEIPPLKDIHFDGSLDDLLVNFMAASLACRAMDPTDAVNFRQDDLSFTKRMEIIKSYAGVWAKVVLVLVLLWLSATGLDVYLKARVNNELTEKIRQEFSSAMPAGTPMVDPIKQMEQQLGRVSGKAGGPVGSTKDSPLEILNDISVGIPRDIDVVFDNITMDENTVTLSGSTKSYDNVEKIKANMSSLGFFSEVKIVTANVDKTNQRVNVKLLCRR